MKNRKRVNISVDADTYDRLHTLSRTYGFRSRCELVCALVRILLDRMCDKAQQAYDLAEDDSNFISQMFDDLGYVERVPDGTVPVRHPRRSLL